MALSKQMQTAFNEQITCELGASLTYLQMAAHLEADERPGMASWMNNQAAEEAGHAQLFIDFVLARDGYVEIGSIPAPISKFDSPVHVFEEALRHEQRVTERIRAMYRLATELDDLESLPFLHGFLSEQVEEEATVRGISERMQRLEGNEVGLALIEHELASRGTDGE